MTAEQLSFQYGQHQVTLATGKIARQATAAVMASMNDTVVLVSVVAEKQAQAGGDFFPLTVDYQERSYAAGKIPGNFFKREGRPSEKETLTSRLIDRPIRPLFPKGFNHEVQIIATVLSLDPEIDPDIVSLIGTSAALAISGLPFNGPVGAARVGYINHEWVLNPTFSQLKQSALDLVVAGTDSAVLMVESEAKQLPEEIMLEAVLFGHEQGKTAVNAIREFAAKVAKPAWAWQAKEKDPVLVTTVVAKTEQALSQAYQIKDKLERQAAVAAVREQLLVELCGSENPQWLDYEVVATFDNVQKNIVRTSILAGNPRIDGRDNHTVRPITIETDVLPRTHGSALFTRGETQALVATTLSTERDVQVVDALEGESKDPFMLHYNFPPYCVAEIGRVGSPKRREIGHGRLAKRALLAVMPDLNEFPYVVRVVSEITESNGSSSMASVCGSSLSMMNAGVPLKAPVAGIAMGLIKEDEQFAVLTDIMGDEDHLGDMDFKVAGTETGVTALQMDIKIEGITRDIMQTALNQAKQGRLHILAIMAKALDHTNAMSDYAPRITSFHINPEKIRDVIGKGGTTIRGITEQTGVTIDISDNGEVKLAATSSEASQRAREMIERLTAEVEVGKIYTGKVAKIMDFGAFVNVLPGKDGLVHISQIAEQRVNKVTDVLQEGETVQVKVLEIDKQGRIRLSMKAVHAQEEM